MTNPRQYLTFEQALSLIPSSEFIHCFTNPAGMILGASWARHLLIREMKKAGPRELELAGETAMRLGHGIAFHDKRTTLFVETDERELKAFLAGGI